jgi:hypothetical protein
MLKTSATVRLTMTPPGCWTEDPARSSQPPVRRTTLTLRFQDGFITTGVGAQVIVDVRLKHSKQRRSQSGSAEPPRLKAHAVPGVPDGPSTSRLSRRVSVQLASTVASETMFARDGYGSMTRTMATYEYKIQIYDKSSIMEGALSIPDHLTAQGRDGWHVVATIDGGHQIAFVMEWTA